MFDLDVNSCRICFAENGSIQLFDSVDEFNVASLLESVINIKLQPTAYASNLICKNCLQMINTSAKFKKDVEQAEDRWNKLFVDVWISKYDKNIEFIKSEETSPHTDDNKDQTEEKSEPNKGMIELIKPQKADSYVIDHDSKGNENSWQNDVIELNSDDDLDPDNQKNHLPRGKRGKKSMPYICQICSKQFANITNLRKHKMTTHNSVKKRTCDYCNKLFSRQDSLTRHIRVVHYKEKRYVCVECNKAFGDVSNLQVHLRLHTGEKPFACDYCGIRFVQSSNLMQHKARHIKKHDRPKTFCKQFG